MFVCLLVCICYIFCLFASFYFVIKLFVWLCLRVWVFEWSIPTFLCVCAYVFVTTIACLLFWSYMYLRGRACVGAGVEHRVYTCMFASARMKTMPPDTDLSVRICSRTAATVLLITLRSSGHRTAKKHLFSPCQHSLARWCRNCDKNPQSQFGLLHTQIITNIQ